MLGRAGIAKRWRLFPFALKKRKGIRDIRKIFVNKKFIKFLKNNN